MDFMDNQEEMKEAAEHAKRLAQEARGLHSAKKEHEVESLTDEEKQEARVVATQIENDLAQLLREEHRVHRKSPDGQSLIIEDDTFIQTGEWQGLSYLVTVTHLERDEERKANNFRDINYVFFPDQVSVITRRHSYRTKFVAGHPTRENIATNGPRYESHEAGKEELEELQKRIEESTEQQR